jgi:hypothetical protein
MATWAQAQLHGYIARGILEPPTGTYHLQLKSVNWGQEQKTGIAPSAMTDLNACKRRDYSTVTSIKNQTNESSVRIICEAWWHISYQWCYFSTWWSMQWCWPTLSECNKGTPLKAFMRLKPSRTQEDFVSSLEYLTRICMFSSLAKGCLSANKALHIAIRKHLKRPVLVGYYTDT